MRDCTNCGERKPLEAFYKHPFGKDGRQSRCIDCTKAAVRANRKSRIEYYRAYDRERSKFPHRLDARKEYTASNQRKPRPEPDPIKRDARVAIGNAVRDGVLVKPETCDVCSASSDIIHGHHDDYSKPLDVIWCCTACHALIHAYWRAQGRLAA